MIALVGSMIVIQKTNKQVVNARGCAAQPMNAKQTTAGCALFPGVDNWLQIYTLFTTAMIGLEVATTKTNELCEIWSRTTHGCDANDGCICVVPGLIDA